MKDKLGRPLAIGDHVVYADRGFSNVSIGKIERFTKCYVIFNKYTRCEPNRVIKISEIIPLIPKKQDKNKSISENLENI